MIDARNALSQQFDVASAVKDCERLSVFEDTRAVIR